MGTKTYRANRSSLLADSGSTNLGGGADTHLPAGAGFSGYTFASVVDFPAIAWADVKNIISARVDFTVTNGVHADPRSGTYLIRRVTAQWSPNGNSSSADSPAGGGWGTSGAVFGSISGTGVGEVSRTNPPSGSGSIAGWDITEIVRAWAPASVAGGGGQPQYGLYIYGTAGGMEYYSARNGSTSTRPLLVIEYSTDPPNTPTFSKPVGKQGTQRPLYEFTATDPQSLPITLWELQDRPVGGSAEYAPVNQAGGIAAGKVTHTATVDIARGPREVRARVSASGIWSAWSTWWAYGVDRLPTVTGFTAPPATVSGTRRPALTFTVSDADADPIELYDIQVYAAPGGAPTGDAVYVKNGQTGGIGAGTVTHTPTADLPPGELAVRSRARTAGVWSAWSAYHPFLLVVAVPSVTWISPASDGGYPVVEDFDASRALNAVIYWIKADIRPPTGFNITIVHRKLTRLDGAGAPAVIVDSNMGLQPGNGAGVYNQQRNLANDGFGATYQGTVRAELDVTSSNGGVTSTSRIYRAAMGEWFGAIALGDSVTGLAVTTELAKIDQAGVFYRAQSSPTAPMPGAVWLPKASLATVLAALPATNAYLGIWARVNRQGVDADRLEGSGSFEAGLGGWNPGGTVAVVAVAGAADGAAVLRVTGDGTTVGPGAWAPWFPVTPGSTYRLTGSCRRSGGSGTGTGRIKLDTGKDDAVVSLAVVQHVWTNDATSDPWTAKTGTYTVPLDGSVTQLRAYAYTNGTVTAGFAWDYDAITVDGPVPGAAGFDKLAFAWSSLG